MHLSRLLTLETSIINNQQVTRYRGSPAVRMRILRLQRLHGNIWNSARVCKTYEKEVLDHSVDALHT